MNNDLVSRQWLIDEYNRRHQGPPGGALEMIQEAPAADPAKPWHKLSQRDFPPEGDILLWMDTGRCGFPRLARVEGKSIYYWDRANGHETWLKRDEWSRTRWTLIEPPEEEKKANAAASE